MEPTLGELKTLLEALAASSDRREAASVERHVKLGGTVEHLAERIGILSDSHIDLNKRVVSIEADLPKVSGEARRAMESISQLELANQEQWRSISTGQDHIAAHLQKQDAIAIQVAAEATARDKVRQETLAQESLAAKRVDKKRDFAVRMGGVVVPLLIAFLTTVGLITVAIINQRQHDDLVTRISNIPTTTSDKSK